MTRITSILLVAVFVGISLFTGSAVFAGLGALVLAISYAYSTRGYAIEGRELVIRRWIGDVRIPVDAIREVGGHDVSLFGSIRLCGSGGLFGYYGLYRTSGIGNCSWYVTRRDTTVLIRGWKRPVVVSPDERELFVATLSAMAPLSGSAEGAGPMVSNRRATVVGIAVGVIAAVGVIGAVSWALSYSPGPPRFTITPASLTIHDRFYPVTVDAASVDLAGMRVVDFATDSAWCPTARTNGFANSHYQSGWFRVRNGAKVRMYRAGGKRLVLLPPAGGTEPVLVQVDDPDGFMASLRAQWRR